MAAGRAVSALKSAARCAVVLSLTVLAASCIQAIQKTERDESFMRPDPGRAAWRKVAVLPFSGNPAYRRVAAEWLAFRLDRHGLFRIVDPSAAEIELGKKGIRSGGSEVTAEEARTAGQALGADGVVTGSISPGPSTGPGILQAVRVRVVETATGKVVADSTRSGTGRGKGGESPVFADVDAVAEDLVPVLFAAAGKPWSPPPSPAGTPE